jgi:peptidoglycan/LPS O-acetylase OafA/YrhL
MTASSPYRSDIDGLRAIAVLSVLAFHAFPWWIGGGYVGVDVFFVISGYLISGIVIKELEESRFSIRSFYDRRVRRLLPALLTVLTVTLTASALLLYPKELQAFGHDLLLGSAFLANIGHLHEANGYFSFKSDHKLLLHLWSLGVEEQFYLLWPPLLLLAYRWRRLGLIIGLATLLSLVFSGYWTALHPADAFYLPTTRFWELGLGALLAYVALKNRSTKGELLGQGKALSQVASVVGVIFIGVAVGRFTPYLPIPGLYVLLPTLGAGLVLAAGTKAFANRWVLAHPLLVHIGKISYPLYLWHWPLLAMIKVTASKPPGTFALAGALGAAVVAAELTYWLVEKPLRQRAMSRQVVGCLLVGIVLSAMTGYVLQEGILRGRIDDEGVAQLEGAMQQKDYPGRQNYGKTEGFSGVEAGPAESPRTALFIGDSHVEQYWTRMEALATSGRATRKARFITYSGCPDLPGLNQLDPRHACDRYLAYAFAQASSPEVDTIVLSSHWEVYFQEGFEEAGHQNPVAAVADPTHNVLTWGSPATQGAFAALERQVLAWERSGKRVFIVLPNPTSDRLNPAWQLPDRFAWNWQASRPPARAAVVSRSAFVRGVAPVYERLRGLAQRTQARLIDPLDALCEADACSAMSEDGQFRYRDADHLRREYVRASITYLDAALLEP